MSLHDFNRWALPAWIVGPTGGVEEETASSLKVFGPILQKSWLSLAVDQMTRERLEMLAKHSSALLESITLRTLNGPRAFDVHVEPEKNGHLVIVREVTAREELRGELIKTQVALQMALQQSEHQRLELEKNQRLLVAAGKMAALSDVATGMAHEFNQPLMMIKGAADEIAATVGKSEHVDIMMDAVGRVSKLLGALRAYADNSRAGERPVEIAALLENVRVLQQHRFNSEGVELVIDIPTKLLGETLLTDPGQVEVVLMNLLHNARDEMVVALKSADSRASKVVTLSVRREHGWVFEVSEAGRGVPEHLRDRVFEPFFTTKDPGKGMGLGLYLSHGIAKQLGGSLGFEERKGGGTVFGLVLPG